MVESGTWSSEETVEYGGAHLTPCYYCGIPADSEDHVPPQVARARIVAQGLLARYPFRTVPACRECNSALGDRGIWTLTDRKHWIKDWLRRRYRKYLVIPDWTDSELMALGPNLRGYVMASVERQRIIRERIRW